MSWIVSIQDHGHTEYIAEGRNYCVGGESYVPFTSRGKAKRYSSYVRAVQATKRHGANMYGHIEIEWVEDGNDN